MEPPRRERRRSAEEDRLTGASRRDRAAAVGPPPAAPKTDPIFSRPYEPGTAAPVAAASRASSCARKAPQRQVAALLGGLVTQSRLSACG